MESRKSPLTKIPPSSFGLTYRDTSNSEEEPGDKDHKSDKNVFSIDDIEDCSSREVTPGRCTPKASPVIGRKQQKQLLLQDSPKSPTNFHQKSGVSMNVDRNVSPGNLLTSSSSLLLPRKGIHEKDDQGNVGKNTQMETVHSKRLCVTETSIRCTKSEASAKKKTKKDEVEREPQQKSGMMVFIMLVSVVVVGFAAYSALGPNLPEKYEEFEIKSDHILENFLTSFDELNSSFPMQTNSFWKVLRSGARSIASPESPLEPAVFIFAVPRDAEPTALCIARKYAAIVTKAFDGQQPLEFTYHLQNADTPEHIKIVVDQTLHDAFSAGSRVAIIHELNRLHGKSAMMFHGYCDNDNAPFTRVAIIFMLYFDAVDEESDDLVEKKLSQLWGKYLDSDTLFPLLSRIGNRNAFVRQENAEVLQINNCL